MSRDYIQWQEKFREYINSHRENVKIKINTAEGLKLYAQFSGKNIDGIKFECLNKEPSQVEISDDDFDWYQNFLKLENIKSQFSCYQYRITTDKKINFDDLNFWCKLLEVDIEDILKEEIMLDFNPIKTYSKDSNAYYFYVSYKDIAYLEVMLKNLDTTSVDFDYSRGLPFPLIIHIPTNSVLYLKYNPHPKGERINYFMIFSSYTRAKKMSGTYRYDLYTMKKLSNSFDTAYKQFIRKVNTLYTTYKKQFAVAVKSGVDKSIYKELSYISALYEEVIHVLENTPAKTSSKSRKVTKKQKYVYSNELDQKIKDEIDTIQEILQKVKFVEPKK